LRANDIRAGTDGYHRRPDRFVQSISIQHQNGMSCKKEGVHRYS
jgi:hypothetical protein